MCVVLFDSSDLFSKRFVLDLVHEAAKSSPIAILHGFNKDVSKEEGKIVISHLSYTKEIFDVVGRICVHVCHGKVEKFHNLLGAVFSTLDRGSEDLFVKLPEVEFWVDHSRG